MDVSEIKELIELFESGSIRELEFKQENLALYLNKNETNRSTNQLVQAPVTTSDQDEETIQVIEAKVEELVAVEGQSVTSPIVGVVYTANDPSSPKIVNIGDKVAVGDTLCIIEAMKIMNEIKSDVAGVITEILVENEDVVEFGQTLFRIA